MESDQLIHKEITDRIIGAAIEVHGALGPGSALSACSAVNNSQEATSVR